jgi:hypothetical protein
MMLSEISTFLDSFAGSADARSLIIDANVLNKRTTSSRLVTFRHLNAHEQRQRGAATSACGMIQTSEEGELLPNPVVFGSTASTRLNIFGMHSSG